jgi:hypothetical protein
MKRFIDTHSITKSGKVYSHYYKKYMYLEKRPSGYITVQISKNGKRKNFFVHRLVAKAYIPNPDNLPHINHKNGNKSDNRVTNLEWCNSQQNMDHAIANKLFVPKRNLTDENRQAIIALRYTNFGATKIARTLSLSYDVVRDYLRGNTYKWDPVPKQYQVK